MYYYTLTVHLNMKCYVYIAVADSTHLIAISWVVMCTSSEMKTVWTLLFSVKKRILIYWMIVFISLNEPCQTQSLYTYILITEYYIIFLNLKIVSDLYNLEKTFFFILSLDSTKMYTFQKYNVLGNHLEICIIEKRCFCNFINDNSSSNLNLNSI